MKCSSNLGCPQWVRWQLLKIGSLLAFSGGCVAGKGIEVNLYVDADVIVIGIGPVGNFLMHLLAAYGVPRVIGFEKDLGVHTAPRAVAWDDYTMRTASSVDEEMHDWMHWHARLIADQWAMNCVGIRGGRAADRFGACDSYSSNQRWRRAAMATSRPPSVYFNQPSWERWLQSGLDKLETVTTHWGAEVLDSADVGGLCRVKVRLADNTTKNYQARYCVGADGGTSKTRKRLGLRYEGETFPDQPWLVVDTIVHDVDYLKTAWIGYEGSGFIANPKCPMVHIVTPAFFEEWWAEAEAEATARAPKESKGSIEFRRLRDEAMSRMAAVRIPKRFPQGNATADANAPLLPPGTHFRFEFLVPGNTSDETATSEAYVNNLLQTCAEVDIDRIDIGRAIVYTFHARRAARWKVGPILLAGDAAHCMPPFQGQGMNSGIRDVANMAWKMSLILRGLAVDSILDTYEPERRSNLKQVTEHSIGLGKFVMVENPLVAYVRDWCMWVFNYLRSKFDFFEGVQYILFVEPPHIISDASLLAQGQGQEVAGRLLPSPEVWTASSATPDYLDRFIAPNAFTIILCLATNEGAVPLPASAGPLKFLRKLNATAIAVDPFAATLNGLTANEIASATVPVVQGLAGGKRFRDAWGHWTRWTAKYNLVNRVLLVRPDRYIFGSYGDVDSLARELSKVLGISAEVDGEGAQIRQESRASAEL